MRMKIIVVRQPWAWLIVAGHKDIENRTWTTSHRGPILIQASAKRPSGYDMDCAIAYARERDVGVPVEELVFGGIVGVADVIDCVSRHDSPWFMGSVGWILRNARVAIRSVPRSIGNLRGVRPSPSFD
jgi:hypothetical protein